MKNKVLSCLAIAVLVAMSSCSGMRDTSQTFTTHAEAFRIVGVAIPGDDQQAALGLVPAGATITNINSSPADWTSFFGVLSNILGISSTRIGGTK